ncbi:hypothetical protein Pmar_PMAR004418, partial [Perkinsus marinus ATCC 50983]
LDDGCIPGAGDDDRPIGHDTHNLFLYDKKNKDRLFLVTIAQSENISLKELAKKVSPSKIAGIKMP